MTLEIRRLDPVTDAALFETMYTWLVDGPEWRRAAEKVFATVDHDAYVSATHSDHRIDIGVFEHGKLTACVTFTLTAKHTYEVHLEAARNASVTAIVRGGGLIRDQIFGWHGAQLVYAWVPSFNRTVKSILRAIGFQADNVTMLRGSYRNRVIEWQHLVIGADYGRQ